MRALPVVDPAGQLRGVVEADIVRSVLRMDRRADSSSPRT